MILFFHEKLWRNFDNFSLLLIQLLSPCHVNSILNSRGDQMPIRVKEPEHTLLRLTMQIWVDYYVCIQSISFGPPFLRLEEATRANSGNIANRQQKESYDVLRCCAVKSCSRRKESGASFSSDAITHVQRRISPRLSWWQTFLIFTPPPIHGQRFRSDAFIGVMPVKGIRKHSSELRRMEVDSMRIFVRAVRPFCYLLDTFRMRNEKEKKKRKRAANLSINVPSDRTVNFVILFLIFLWQCLLVCHEF